MVCFCVFYRVKCIVSFTLTCGHTNKRRNADLPPKICTLIHLNVHLVLFYLALLVYSLLYIPISGNCTETFGIPRSAVVVTTGSHVEQASEQLFIPAVSCCCLSELIQSKASLLTSVHVCITTALARIFLTPKSVAELL